MKNPIYRIIETGKPFVYFHTLVFNENILELAENSGKSLEIDISISKNGELFIGHPSEFYAFKQIAAPLQNLPIDIVIKDAKASDLFLVLDCKDVRAIPHVEQIITKYGSGQTLFHSWVKEFEFKPYAPEITVEPHWIYEDLPLDEVLKLKHNTSVPVVSSARGLTMKRLLEEPEIIDKIIEMAAGKVEAINFNLPNNQAPPREVIDKLLKHHLLTWLNVDLVPARELPSIYLGISDHIRSVT